MTTENYNNNNFGDRWKKLFEDLDVVVEDEDDESTQGPPHSSNISEHHSTDDEESSRNSITSDRVSRKHSPNTSTSDRTVINKGTPSTRDDSPFITSTTHKGPHSTRSHSPSFDPSAPNRLPPATRSGSPSFDPNSTDKGSPSTRSNLLSLDSAATNKGPPSTRSDSPSFDPTATSRGPSSTRSDFPSFNASTTHKEPLSTRSDSPSFDSSAASRGLSSTRSDSTSFDSSATSRGPSSIHNGSLSFDPSTTHKEPFSTRSDLPSFDPSATHKDPPSTRSSSPSSSSSHTMSSKGDAVQSHIFSREYDLPSRTDLVSVQTNAVLSHLKTFRSDGNVHNGMVVIDVIRNSPPHWRVEANETQHEEMRNVLKRLDDLVDSTVNQQKLFARDFESVSQNFAKNVSRCRGMHTERGKMYSQILQKGLEEHKKTEIEEFNKAVVGKCHSLVVNGGIKNEMDGINDLKNYSKSYLHEHPVDRSFQQLKGKAFHIFVKQWRERWKLEKNDADVDKVLDHHLQNLETTLASDPLYSGIEMKQIALIPSLLLRVEIFCRCAQLGLDLFKSSVDILEKISENKVISISTATGSGKSTLVPSLLAAAGYDRIFVTQPRRLACNSISARVNETVGKISGWAVSGARSENDENTSVMYLTDGLLKKYLQFHEDKMISDAESSNLGFVFFIDEVHERSTNIDMCLALLARLLRQNLKDKVKIVISSATLDDSVEKLFNSNDYFALKIKSDLRFKVKTHPNSQMNMFDLIERLKENCNENEQILCFVKSNSDVTQSIDLLKDLKKIEAFPLVESQSSAMQQKLVSQEQVFFSTTVAQTSLTFPCLKYVIDTGIINMSIYNAETDTTLLTNIPASESTIKQRKGRLGRTQSGEYFPLYKSSIERSRFPTPQICQSELSNVDFSLRKSPVKEGLTHFKKWLADPPDDSIIKRATDKLKSLDILNDAETFTKKGEDIALLPDFGTLAMTTSVYAALSKYQCGRDVILLGAMLDVLNTSAILRKLPERYHRPNEGDYMSILALMQDLTTETNSMKNGDLGEIRHHLTRALVRLKALEAAFDTGKPEWRQASRVSSGEWSVIAKALLEGHLENVYVAQSELHGRNNQYDRYNVSPEHTDRRKQTAVLDKSTTIPYDLRPPMVFAKDAVCSTAVRATSILSFIGVIEPSWLHDKVKRLFKVTAREMEQYQAHMRHTLPQNIQSETKGSQLLMSGPVGDVFEAEKKLRQQMVKTYEWSFPESEDFERFPTLRANMKIILRDLSIFLPLIWRWSNERQAKIKLDKQPPSSCKVTATCREQDYQRIKAEFDYFVFWLSQCERVQQKDTTTSLQVLKQRDAGIEERIQRVTDPSRTWADLKPAVSQGTRESRMDVAAWIAVCRFNCRLLGSFVRDRIVANRINRPKDANPETWVSYDQTKKIPELTPELGPSELDCHLPTNKYFDIEHFLDEMHKYEFVVQVFRLHWRYILLFDQEASTGPFIMNLIEPHVALTHDRIDFDINNLYVERGETEKLGQRTDLSGPPCSSDLDDIVKNIRLLRFKVLRPIDQRIQDAIAKLQARGYSQDGPPLSLPQP